MGTFPMVSGFSGAEVTVEEVVRGQALEKTMPMLYYLMLAVIGSGVAMAFTAL